jgi:glucose/arabinose dehydrogenase
MTSLRVCFAGHAASKVKRSGVFLYMSRNSLHFVVVIFLFLATPGTAAGAPIVSAATIPSALAFTPVATGLTAPVFVTNAGDGSNRLFIVQQTGQIRIFKNGSLLSTPFLNILGSAPNFTGMNGEQGLLGLAFDPNYLSNGFFYITYTTTNTDTTFVYTTTLARYHVSGGNPDLADASSGEPLLSAPKKYWNHNGGMVAFGPDGYLYMTVGDGGSGGDPDNNAQNIHSLLGKLLRLDVETTPPTGKKYVIPPTNPYYGDADATVKQEIWAYGLRNPWRFSFDRTTGDLYIGDVGQATEEEVDFQAGGSAGGQNYGWRVREGNLCYDPAVGCSDPTGYVGPVATYDHGASGSYGCAVTGGYVYRGSDSVTLQGVYFYGDYCSGKVLGLIRNPDNSWSFGLIVSTPYSISSFGQDEQGELYLADYSGGTIYRISESPASPRILGIHPADGSEVCLRPQVGADLLLTDLVRNAGSFDPSKVTLTLDGADMTLSASSLETMDYPASHASISDTPLSDLTLGAHQAKLIRPSAIGPLTTVWNFTVASIPCPTGGSHSPALEGGPDLNFGGNAIANP